MNPGLTFMAGLPGESLAVARPDVINLALKASTGPDAIRELLENTAAIGGIRDHPRLLDDLLARHALDPTCLDAGIALPHARSVAVDRLICIVGRSDREIRYSDRHPRVRLVIVAGVPVHARRSYLRWLADLATGLRRPAVRAALHAARTEAEFAQVWREALAS